MEDRLMKTAGIDYGMGRTNIDPVTGCRYGVISQHSLASWFYDDYEPQYGDPTCPKCGETAHDASDYDSPLIDEYEQGTGRIDYACEHCAYLFDSSEAYGDAPQGFMLEDDDYTAVDCLDSDVMILRSPYYTYAPFCSPCVPGAGNLDSIQDERIDSTCPKTLCFGHEMFEERRAPYRVFRVADDTEVFPDAK
jgi:rubredoxin